MTTLTSYIGEYVERRRKRGEITAPTARVVRSTLLTLDHSFGSRPIHHLTPLAMDRWLESIGDRAPATRRCYQSRVRLFCRWLVREGVIRSDPTVDFKHVTQPRRTVVTFTPEEVAAIYRTVAGDLRAEAMVAVFIGCGPRCVEISRLQMADYKPRERTIHFIGKALHERTVHVPAEARTALDAYLDMEGRIAGPLFRNRTYPGRSLSAHTISSYFREWAIAAGVKTAPFDGRGAHGMRRTAGSDVLAECGGDIQVVQEMLGHKDPRTTIDLYMRPVSLTRLSEAMEGRTYRAPATDADDDGLGENLPRAA